MSIISYPTNLIPSEPSGPSVAIPQATDLEGDEAAALNDLFGIWVEKRPMNALLGAYYKSEQYFANMGIAIPDSLRNMHGALGWPAKAVQGLARLHQFEGFSIHGNTDPFEINEVLDANEFDLELGQTITSAYKHSCAFITTTRGDESAGEPKVMIQARDAEWTAAKWDKRRRQIKYAMAITDTDSSAEPSRVILFLRDTTITLEKVLGKWIEQNRHPNPTSRVMLEPIAYDPQLDRPFGNSRITREVRYLTDAAIRTMLRSEIHSEFFSSPRVALLAADKSQFDETSWNAMIGRIWAIGLNEESEAPQMQQLSQSSMTPHAEMYRLLAQNFAAATSLPLNSVGLFTENPASAEAMEMAWAPLASDGEYQWRVFRPRLKRLAQNIVMLRDGLDAPPAESWKMQVNWTPCRYVSPTVAADWAVKAVGADPELQGTSVVRRRLGLTQGELDEVDSEIRKRGSRSLIDSLLAPQEPVEVVETPPADPVGVV